MFTLAASMVTVWSCSKSSDSASATVSELTCDVVSTDVSTTGGSDGTITVTVKTGNTGYNYTLSSATLTTPLSNLTGQFTGLKAGSYTVNVTDSKQKTFSKTVSITEPNQLICTVDSTNVTTNGGSDGTITIKVTSGNGGYNFTITNTTTNVNTSNTTGVFTGLTAAVYNIKVTDSKNSTFNRSVTITNPYAPSFSGLTSSNITNNSATISGNYNVYGVFSVIQLKYGTNRNNMNMTNNAFVQSTGSGVFSSNLTSLTLNTTYYYTIYSKIQVNNVFYYYYSDTLSFTTKNDPTFELLDATNITATSVTFNGNVNSNDGSMATSVYFQFSTNNTTFSTDNTVYSADVNGITLTPVNVTLNENSLSSNTVYYYRMLLEKNGEYFYSTVKSFKTAIQVGSQMFGGIVFSVTGTYPNQHGMVIQNSDYTNSVTWTSVFAGGAIYTDCTITDNNGIIWRVPLYSEIQLAYSETGIFGIWLNSSHWCYWVGDRTSTGRGWFIPSQSTNNYILYHDPTSTTAHFRLVTTF